MTKVHILATCRKSELLRATTLVFDTIRTGFPTAKIEVDWNGSDSSREISQTCQAATTARATFTVFDRRTHHEWVAQLIREEQEPFWICDTDVVFWYNMEKFCFDGTPLAGRYVPQFKCNFANAITKPRFHTCLLYIDPKIVKKVVGTFGELSQDVYCLPRPTIEDLVFPRYIPDIKGMRYFYDTTSLLFQCVSGVPFNKDELNSFDHLNSATLSDLVAPCYPEYRMRETHFAIFENPQLAKGSWKLQDEFYAKHAC